MKRELLPSSFDCCLLDCFALGYYSLLDLPPRLQMYLFSDEIYCCFERCTRDKTSAPSNTSPEPNPFPEQTQSCCIGLGSCPIFVIVLGHFFASLHDLKAGSSYILAVALVTKKSFSYISSHTSWPLLGYSLPHEPHNPRFLLISATKEVCEL